MPNWRKRIKIASLLAAGILLAAPVVTFAAWLICQRHLQSKCDEKIAEIKAAGHPVTWLELEKLYPPLPPGKQNAADIYEKAFAAMEKVKDQVYDPDNRWKTDASSSKEGKINLELVPIAGTAHEPKTVGAEIPKKILEESQRYLDLNKEALAEAENAVKLKHCRFPIDFSLGYKMKLWHLPGINKLHKLVLLDALIAAERGDSAHAFRSLMNSYRTAEAVSGEPISFSKLVELQLLQRSISFSRDIITKAGFGKVELLALQQKALELESSTLPLKMATISTCIIYIDYRQSTSSFWNKFSNKNRIGSSEIEHNRYKSAWLCLREKNEIKLFSDFKELIESLELPFDERLAKFHSIQDRWEYLNDMDEDSFLGVGFLKGNASLVIKQAALISLLRAERAALAVELYRIENGKFPESLGDLVPQYMAELPQDPFNKGQPLRYKSFTLTRRVGSGVEDMRIEEDAYAVYGCAANGKDYGDKDALNLFSTGSEHGICFGAKTTVCEEEIQRRREALIPPAWRKAEELPKSR